MYTILGATGNTGKLVSLSLLNEGKNVRVVSRDKEKAKELTDKGAELVLGSSTDYEVLNKAFEGAEAAYLLIPPNYSSKNFYQYQKDSADAIVKALKNSSVKYVVFLSSVGAQMAEDSGVVQGLKYMEQKLNEIEGLNVLSLRPTYFMENTFGMINIIKNMGVMGSPVKADIKINMIASEDIGNYAAQRLLALDFEGKSHQYLLGQRDLTYKEVASILGAAIGKSDLKYIEFTHEDFKNGFMQFGASENMTDRMIIFIEGVNRGKVFEGVERTAESTTPTSIEEFAKTFAFVYNQ